MSIKLDAGLEVEITEPNCGSACLIGGRLVLTSAHVVGEVNSDCTVRSKNTFGVVSAKVVWVAEKADIALVELPNSIKSDPSRFGKFPPWHQSHRQVELLFDSYGYPDYATTPEKNDDGTITNYSSGQPIKGRILLGAECRGDLLVLHCDRCPENISEPDKSPWGGISGASIVCNDLIVAVVKWQQKPGQPNSLQAQSLHVVYDDPEWKRLLEEHGINPEFQEIRIAGNSIQKVRKLKAPIGPSNAVVPTIKLRSTMVDFLSSLDCDDQQSEFKNKLKMNPKAAAFVVKAPCKPTRKWLVHRLSQLIPNYKSAIYCTMNPTEYSTEANFWGHLASELSQIANVSSDSESILQYLGGGNSSRPIIISIHNLEKKTREFENIVLNEFWRPLNQRLTLSQSRQSRESRIILFLTKKSHAKSAQNHLVLPLKNLSCLSTADVDEWLAKLSDLNRKTPQRKVLVTKLKSLPMLESSNPGAVINQLCGHVGLSRGIVDLEHFWERAS
jgi:hypothetical protein